MAPTARGCAAGTVLNAGWRWRERVTALSTAQMRKMKSAACTTSSRLVFHARPLRQRRREGGKSQPAWAPLLKLG